MIVCSLGSFGPCHCAADAWRRQQSPLGSSLVSCAKRHSDNRLTFDWYQWYQLELFDTYPLSILKDLGSKFTRSIWLSPLPCPTVPWILYGLRTIPRNMCHLSHLRLQHHWGSIRLPDELISHLMDVGTPKVLWLNQFPLQGPCSTKSHSQ